STTLQSQVFFNTRLGKGEEILDYSYSYRVDGATVRSATVNYYEGNRRASNASADDALVQSDTHRTTAIGAVAVSNRRSSTFFDIRLGKDEEIADYSYNYRNNGNTVRSVSLNFYEGDLRAHAASTEDALIRTESYNTSSVGEAKVSNRRSATFFNIRFGKGEEIADYFFNYASNGTSVKNTAYSFYGAGQVRAVSAAPDDRLARQDTYRLDHEADSSTLIKSKSYYTGEAGSEILDMSQTFNLLEGVKETTRYYYGDTYLPASSAGDAPLRKTSTFRDITATLRSETFFGGDKDEEKARSAFNYNNIGDRVKSTTLFNYNLSTGVLESSVVYRGLVDWDLSTAATTASTLSAAAGQITVSFTAQQGVFYQVRYRPTLTDPWVNASPVTEGDGGTRTFTEAMRGGTGFYQVIKLAVKRSETIYHGIYEGEELADYTLNYRGDGLTVKNTTYLLYGAGSVPASSADVDDALSRQDTYRGNHVTDASTKLQSQVFFDTRLGKGDEILDYVYNYRANGTDVRSVTVNWYEGGNRASAASAEDALSRTDTHKTTSIGAVAVSNRRSSTFFNTRFGKDEEITDYSFNYKADGQTVRNTTLYYYEQPAGPLVNAQNARSDAALGRQETYRKNKISDQAAKLSSLTYFQTHFGKGEEIADYTFNYRADGFTVRNTAYSLYGVSAARAVNSSDLEAKRSSTTPSPTARGRSRKPPVTITEIASCRLQTQALWTLL
ncbi:MAG: hypothetical protein HYZ87_00195, partial [Candidatus Omnitrophica bacterium]|nr:hypothetical protein [Candidatus Omnitrophota bacterium]